MICAMQFNPNQPDHYVTASAVWARQRQIRAPKKHILFPPFEKTTIFFEIHRQLEAMTHFLPRFVLDEVQAEKKTRGAV